MSLKELRARIDKIDGEIIRILNERARLAVKIGKLKHRQGKDVYVPDREAQVYHKIAARNKGPLDARALSGIYKEIMSSSLSLEKPLRISYFGLEASFTHMAACQKFGSQSRYVSARSINDCFMEVSKGRSDYGVVPVENSSEGVVNHTLDMFVDSELVICAEVLLGISHYLLSKSPPGKIKKVYSNPQALAQCRIWLENNLPGADLLEVTSTSEGAQKAAGEKTSAAVASKLAAEIYGLKIAAEKIEDSATNITRFLVIGRTEAGPTGNDKTSLMFSVKDKPGALYQMLRPFAANKINMTKIESRPSRRRAWDYVFFVDITGHQSDKRVNKAVRELEKECRYLKILGSYPQGVL